MRRRRFSGACAYAPAVLVEGACESDCCTPTAAGAPVVTPEDVPQNHSLSVAGIAVNVSYASVSELAPSGAWGSAFSKFDVRCHHESEYSAIFVLRRCTSSGENFSIVARTRARRMCSSSSASPYMAKRKATVIFLRYATLSPSCKTWAARVGRSCHVHLYSQERIQACALPRMQG